MASRKVPEANMLVLISKSSRVKSSRAIVLWHSSWRSSFGISGAKRGALSSSSYFGSSFGGSNLIGTGFVSSFILISWRFFSRIFSTWAAVKTLVWVPFRLNSKNFWSAEFWSGNIS
ncbi:unnamed protein product [Blepharisma stoltei]|uniref:Uncharacterized protein n=1 Tax=Blepharisma stoltei TaxID=1481888 RepID=A0AAU9JS57_9CILI|nr:unnamed protein product [Blepharisma stoltei]